MTLHERDLDARVSKLERDNAVLVSTLKVIAGSFGVLNRLFPEIEGVVARHGGGLEGEMMPKTEEDERVESLVKDLGRVRRDGSRKSNNADGGIGTLEEGGRVRLEESE
jgi:hypothetical protein